ncbi:MAG: hypothetical protein CVU44_11660 [Chloroflexi bacterium HGW-Chloroflexi-6]|nr:MAG: hypothetical protein CVU44_11660 [Chloroflexi bacterium HGW-Chloroflexi-6]
MEWTISFLPDQKIAVIETRGVADEAGSIEMAQDISKTMAKYLTTRCLIDHSALSAISSSTIGIYNRPTGLIKIGVPFRIKIAEVVLPAHKKHFGFLETVCRNRGFDFCIFDDRESALQWLTK